MIQAPEDLKKPIFSKSNENSIEAIEFKNIYIKAILESPKHFHQAAFETLKYQQENMF